MSSRRTLYRPLPLSKLQSIRWNGSSCSSSPSISSPPSPNFPALNSVKSIENALTCVEARIHSELDGLRVSYSQALVSEQLRAEKLRAQSIAYQKERDFAWAKVKALMAEKIGVQSLQPVHNQRRSRSCGALSSARLPRAAAKLPRPSSPHVSSQPGPYCQPSAPSSASSSSASLVEIKREEEPVSLTSSRSASPASPSETLVADDAWSLMYPESSSSSPELPPGKDVITLPPLKRCHSDSSVAKATHFQWIELPDGTRVALSGTKKASSHILIDDHLKIIFKEHRNRLVCRMCILEQKKLDKEKRAQFLVASFDLDGSPLLKYSHCLQRHPKESEEMAKLPRSMLLEMQKGLARTNHDEDFELDYILID
ncbi:hypothetical protein C0995_013970 [Termitomyces sp. Mi166|nr:hypothetical protein C0995_013970 [Termitomyces sp. Mi166\